MRHEDHGFALPIWLSWIAQQRQNHQHQISTGHPSIPSPGPESDWSSSPRACENRAHPASPKTNTRRKESQPKPGSDIEQPPRAIVRTRSRKRERHAVLKHHIWRPVQARQRLPINSRAHRRLLQAQHHMYEHASKRCQRNTTGGAAAPPIFTGKQRSRSRKWSMRQERRENSR
jgi:hypothetical protein